MSLFSPRRRTSNTINAPRASRVGQVCAAQIEGMRCSMIKTLLAVIGAITVLVVLLLVWIF
jgi:hypothetical protein